MEQRIDLAPADELIFSSRRLPIAPRLSGIRSASARARLPDHRPGFANGFRHRLSPFPSAAPVAVKGLERVEHGGKEPDRSPQPEGEEAQKQMLAIVGALFEKRPGAVEVSANRGHG